MLEIIFHGHSSVQITTGGQSIIIDPFITHNPLAKVKVEDIKVQYVLLTHAHEDHIGDAAAIAKNNDATIVTMVELANYFSWQGVKTQGMNLGGAREFEFGRVKLTQAFHSSGVTLDQEKNIMYMGMPSGLLLTIEGKTIYHAGDTALFGDMKMYGELNNIDLAFLPIGDNYTMGPEDALIAAKWLNAKLTVPVHYNTFDLLKQDGQLYVDKLTENGLNGKVVQPGESFTL
ncbi:metal-dependent hydrolase [Paenibacillus pinihumi]|uniref:metal-dependent hydrolase n=1 Tax=Paenibacillus pinihumi TaxID=669462 RepID=UPI0004917AB5|nr:metal-dependent hydrolase [Paenibacillus pinihumi]